MAAPPTKRAWKRRDVLHRGGRIASLAAGALVLPMTDLALARPADPDVEIALPAPDRDGRLTLEAALTKRRSVRNFAPGPLTPAEVAQLLWAGQGITGAAGLRTAPSAGALYPLELLAVIGDVDSVPAGVYGYAPAKHALTRVGDGDRRGQLARAALSQAWIRDSAVILAIVAVPRRTTVRYGERGRRYIDLEAGHVAQNICLQATALDLAVTPVGAFRDDAVHDLLGLGRQAQPVYLLPVGRR